MKLSMLKKESRKFESNVIFDTLQHNNWSRTKTAEILEIPMSTLKYKMALFGIYKRIPNYRPRKKGVQLL